jgi:hypothetical protein
MNLFVNILPGPNLFSTHTSLPCQRDNLAVARQLFSHFLFVVCNHQSCKLGPGSVRQAAQGTSGQGGREKEWKSSLEVASLVQLLSGVASLVQSLSEVASLAQLSPEVASLAQSSSEVVSLAQS